MMSTPFHRQFPCYTIIAKQKEPQHEALNCTYIHRYVMMGCDRATLQSKRDHAENNPTALSLLLSFRPFLHPLQQRLRLHLSRILRRDGQGLVGASINV